MLCCLFQFLSCHDLKKKKEESSSSPIRSSIWPVLSLTIKLIKSQVHAGSFCVSVILQTQLSWTTGSLTCVHDNFCVCVYTQGLGTPTASQHNIFDSKKLTKFFLCSWRDIRSYRNLSLTLPIDPPHHCWCQQILWFGEGGEMKPKWRASWLSAYHFWFLILNFLWL